MRPELEKIEHLERFVQDQLPPEQEQDLRIQLLWDQDLQQQVASQQTAYIALREAGRQQLRRELRQIHQRLFG